MNQKIEKLANDAGLGIKHDGLVLTKNVIASEALEKFAMAIVDACNDIYDQWAEYSTDSKSFRLARHNVNKQFGVE